MSGKIRSAVAVVLVLAVAAGAVLWRMKRGCGASRCALPQACCPHDAGGEETAAKPVRGRPTVAPQRAGVTQAVAIAGTNEPAEAFELDEAELEAERVVAPFQEDLDSDDPKVIAAAARKLMAHANANVRRRAVEALAWVEEEGFADLTAMIRDKDADVALAALEAWALQMQSRDESAEKKAAQFAEIAPVAMDLGADAFQDVLNAMFDLEDAPALKLLQTFAAKTDDPRMLEAILDAVNFRAMPETDISKKEEIPGAIAAFLKREAAEAAAEAADAE